MKYLKINETDIHRLYTAHKYLGEVVKFVEYHPNSNRHLLKVKSFLSNKIFYVKLKHCKDITHIYNKIVELKNRLYTTGRYYPFVCSIKEDFERGHFPSELTFITLNIIWNKSR